MRESGILLHISSLPSRYGIGTLGREAYRFVDFLFDAGQRCWQILPINPTGYGDSPYQSFSTFAGNPYFIDLDLLCDERLLSREECESFDFGKDAGHVDYGKIFENRLMVLRIAFTRGFERDRKEVSVFCNENAYWLNDYTFFMALKQYYHYKPLSEWDRKIRTRETAEMENLREELKTEINFYIYLQFLFFKQWMNLKRYANQKGIRIIGDIPIYVAQDSADVWANNELFWLDEDKRPVMVAGCPPDAFTKDGQLWGNPLYDWNEMEKTGYAWWVQRIKSALTLYDTVRIDHFRGFDSFYAIPSGDKNAKKGKWIAGPGIKIFKAIREQLGEVSIIAEDLGFLTDSVRKLLKDCGYPGMVDLQFAFDSREESDYLPHNYIKNCVVYTGTHDNDTTAGFLNNASERDIKFAVEYLRIQEGENKTDAFIKAALASVAELAIIPMQDYLGLSSEARMNTPSTLGGNWCWRLLPGQINEKLSNKIARMTHIYGRKRPESMVRSFDKQVFLKTFEMFLNSDYQADPSSATIYQIHTALSKTLKGMLAQDISRAKEFYQEKKQAYYFSAEFLVGRLIYNNLYCLGILEEVKEALSEIGIDLCGLEQIEDAALGNGGLGRLAACFLDSAATHQIPLNGYGIRYKYGLFKQEIIDGFQIESADDWTAHGDPWFTRREEDTVEVHFNKQAVKAVPYDMPVIGYGNRMVNNLRLWQAEPVRAFDFKLFNSQKYEEAVYEKNAAEDITKVLYPNDDTEEGKILRLKQQYFFCSASLQDLVRKFVRQYSEDFSEFPNLHAIQLNDTHPVVSIPEFIRILMDDYGHPFQNAFGIAQKTFAYTNHTIMEEALEKWDTKLFQSVIPRVYEIIKMINEHLLRYLTGKGIMEGRGKAMRIIDHSIVHMARLAVYGSSYTNGVAEIHTEILKNEVLKDWYALYPERFQNKTNGITQRRWIGLCNPELSGLFTRLLGTDEWLTNLELLKKAEKFADDETVLSEFIRIKQQKKRELSDFILAKERVNIPSDFIFDIQVKRLHEYKRQLLNAFSILDIYYGLKEGRIKNFEKTAFIFGAKAAPGYQRAKGIIKYIGEIANLINNDSEIRDKMRVLFVSNYNVSYAEKIMPAANISEQISTAGTEASGTGNMKLMLGGAVTLGTYDGANIEIVRESGEENNYIFGARVEELSNIRDSYSPKELYQTNERIRRVLDSLVDGTFDDASSGIFKELYDSILEGKDWHRPDAYFLLYDFEDYVKTKLRAIQDYPDKMRFARKCYINATNAGKFSSDRTVKEYAADIWRLI